MFGIFARENYFFTEIKNSEAKDEKVVIIGAEPAGLVTACELVKDKDFEVVVLEETDAIGGNSQTLRYNGNRMDIGGHRFFSKDDTIMNWWNDRMPLQGAPSFDDKLLNVKNACIRHLLFA